MEAAPRSRLLSLRSDPPRRGLPRCRPRRHSAGRARKLSCVRAAHVRICLAASSFSKPIQLSCGTCLCPPVGERKGRQSQLSERGPQEFDGRRALQYVVSMLITSTLTVIKRFPSVEKAMQAILPSWNDGKRASSTPLTLFQMQTVGFAPPCPVAKISPVGWRAKLVIWLVPCPRKKCWRLPCSSCTTATAPAK